MKMAWRKRLALGLCLVLLLGMLPTTALAATVPDNNNRNTTVDVVEAGNIMNNNNGTVTDNKGTVTNNKGTVTNNYGEVTGNDNSVVSNKGWVTENSGTVHTNDTAGTVARNRDNAMVKTNNGTVRDNYGTVENNAGTIEHNFGTVTQNTGTVVNNYGGTVNNENGGTVKNNYYQLTVVSGNNAEITELKNMAGKTWIKGGEMSATISPKEGYRFLKAPVVAPAGAATVTQITGSYSLSGVTGNIKLTLFLELGLAVTGVSLDKSTLTIAPGKTAALTATVLPADAVDKTVIWSSDKEGVAKVDSSGTVTAVSPGTAVITAKTKDGGFTAECIVTVPVPVAGVALDKTELTIAHGDTDTLTATVSPEDATDKTVSWSSSNLGVAAVSENGEITAVSPGTATITATTKDGEKTASCEVTVTPVSVTGVALDKTELTMDVGATITLQATVAPSNATDKTVSWSSSAPAIASVDHDGKVTALSSGTANITVTTNDGSRMAVCAVTVLAQTGGGSGGDDGPSPTERATSKIEKAKDGDTVELDLPSNGKLPSKVLEAAAGKDVTLEIDAGKGVTWVINGKDIPKDLPALNLKVDTAADTIPVTVLNAVTGEQKVMQLELGHDGPFGFSLTLRLDAGKENAGLYANLYHFNEETETLEYQTTAKIGADGNTDLVFDHASSYAVVIDINSHAPATWENPFTDVQSGDWCYEAVEFVCRAGLMVGVTDSTFAPSGPVTRAQVWMVLARMNGLDTGGGTPWYAPAQAWVVERGISDGENPDEAVTREQLVTMLYRYAQSVGQDVSVGESTNILSYTDALDVAEWAIPAFQWACGSGVVSGTSDTTLSPGAGANRAQLAAILQRFSSMTVE